MFQIHFNRIRSHSNYGITSLSLNSKRMPPRLVVNNDSFDHRTLQELWTVEISPKIPRQNLWKCFPHLFRNVLQNIQDDIGTQRRLNPLNIAHGQCTLNPRIVVRAVPRDLSLKKLKSVMLIQYYDTFNVWTLVAAKYPLTIQREIRN